eukprot:352872-Chlamydomonas_euryale.AAC.5
MASAGRAAAGGLHATHASSTLPRGLCGALRRLCFLHAAARNPGVTARRLCETRLNGTPRDLDFSRTPGRVSKHPPTLNSGSSRAILNQVCSTFVPKRV